MRIASRPGVALQPTRRRAAPWPAWIAAAASQLNAGVGRRYLLSRPSSTLSISRRLSLALGLVLSLAAPQVGVGQVPAPAVTFARTTEAPRRVEWGVTAGRGQRAVGGAFLGALVGAGARYLIGEANCARCDDAAPIIAFSGMGAALGAVVGMIVGLRWPGE